MELGVLELSVGTLTVVVGWLWVAHQKRRWEDFVRKEECYKSLIKATQRCFACETDLELQQTFREELAVCFVHSPDEVIKAGVDLCHKLYYSQDAQADEKRDAFAAFLTAIRNDSITRRAVKGTELDGDYFVQALKDMEAAVSEATRLARKQGSHISAQAAGPALKP